MLISLGILTIGLLGVAALFPVGSYYMQKGEIADRGSALAQAAFNDAVARGVLNPETWLVWEDGWVSASAGNLLSSETKTPNTFTRGFADKLRKQKANLQNAKGTGGWDEVTIQNFKTWEFGSVFVIDPIGIDSFALPSLTNDLTPASDSRMKPGGVYPASSPAIPAAVTARQWQSWSDQASQGPKWPVRRVTLAGSAKTDFSLALTNRRFTSSDDLALDLPTQQDRPAIARWELGNLDGGGVADDPLSRQSRGDYSWVVTVAPTTAEARDALATDPSAHYYEVSVVVFYKRPLGASPPLSRTDMIAQLANLQTNERVARAKIVSTGLSGGELLLERIEALPPSGPAEGPFANLKTGQWIMLCGPHPNSTGERPMMVARWYRVLSIEGDKTKLNAQGADTPPAGAGDPERRLVALRGPQWPWQPEPSGRLDYNHLSNALYICIPTGAVAVHAKTIRLEGNSVWSGGASGVGGTPPPGFTYGVGS